MGASTLAVVGLLRRATRRHSGRQLLHRRLVLQGGLLETWGCTDSVKRTVGGLLTSQLPQLQKDLPEPRAGTVAL